MLLFNERTMMHFSASSQPGKAVRDEMESTVRAVALAIAVGVRLAVPFAETAQWQV